MPDGHESSPVAAARAFGSALRPWIESACSLDWNPSDGFGRIIVRAALRRQLESLDVVIDLAEGDHGFAAVALLRPSCAHELVSAAWASHVSPGSSAALIPSWTATE